jgi:hypothetical protein
MKKLTPIFLLVALLIPLAWFAWPIVLPFLHTSTSEALTSLDAQGKYGDSYGALNTLFTGLAFVGVAGSIVLQIRESRKRDEEYKKDGYESRFFHLHNTFRSAVREIDVKQIRTNREGQQEEVVVFHGKDALRKIVDLILSASAPELRSAQTDDAKKKILIREYERIYRDKFVDDLGPYFRMLFRLFRYIERADESDRIEYMKIVRADLCGSEIILLGINGLTKPGEDFKPLIIKYELTKHWPDHDIIPKKLFESEYKN